MPRTVFILLLVFALPAAGPAGGADFIACEPKPGPGMERHIVLLTGDEEYRSEEGLPMLAEIPSQRHGFRGYKP